MKFKFKIQQYQTDAVEQTVSVFAGQPSKTNAQYRRDLGKRKGQITASKRYSTAEAYKNIAYCYLYQEKHSETLNYINRAIEITNNTGRNIIDTRGDIYMAQTNLNSAIDDFNKAIQLVTNNYELYEYQALCYRKLAETATDENAKLELINNAVDDENEAVRLQKNAGESDLLLAETNEQ